MNSRSDHSMSQNSIFIREEAANHSNSRSRSLSKKKSKSKQLKDVKCKQKQLLIPTISKNNSQKDGTSFEQKINQASTKVPKQRFESFLEISMKVLTNIQLLNYDDPHSKLHQAFRTIVKDYVTFNGVFPKALNRIGKELLKDGIFHEMWGKICKKNKEESELAHYYQCYYAQLQSNHSNFESAFNQNSISIEYVSDIVPYQTPQSQDATTCLSQKARAKASLPSNSFHHRNPTRKDHNDTISLEQSGIFSGRLRLIDQIQSNQRRINAEIACYFLGISRFFNLTDLQICKIVEFYHKQGKELLVLEARLPIYNEQLKKTVIDFKPQILVAMYGYVSLAQLLRVKIQYSNIQGFILYDELLNLELWLKGNDYHLPK